MPLFAAASEREGRTVRELDEPAIALRAMPAGREVVEDYGHIGLSLRRHPVGQREAAAGPEAGGIG